MRSMRGKGDIWWMVYGHRGLSLGCSATHRSLDLSAGDWHKIPRGGAPSSVSGPLSSHLAAVCCPDQGMAPVSPAISEWPLVVWRPPLEARNECCRFDTTPVRSPLHPGHFRRCRGFINLRNADYVQFTYLRLASAPLRPFSWVTFGIFLDNSPYEA